MVFTSDDAFVISSSAALEMAENLVLTLNTVIKSLPEAELRKLRSALGRCVRISDDILYNMTMSSTFYALTLDDGKLRP